MSKRLAELRRAGVKSDMPRAEDPLVNPRFIKVTPEDVEAERVEAERVEAEALSDLARSLGDIRKKKATQLTQRVREVVAEVRLSTQDHRLAVVPGKEEVLYRFHTGDAGLRSAADEFCADRGVPQTLTREQKKQFVGAHAGENKKYIEEVGFSPFVSMTRDLPSLVRTSFRGISEGRIAGDVNIRQDVFERASTISAIVVSKEHVTTPRAELSEAECEACYDTQAGPRLASLPRKEFRNPFYRQIEIDARMLAISRRKHADEPYKSEVIALAEMEATYPPDKRLIDLDVEKYRGFYERKQVVLDELGDIPRADRAVLRQKAAERAEAIRKREALEETRLAILHQRAVHEDVERLQKLEAQLEARREAERLRQLEVRIEEAKPEVLRKIKEYRHKTKEAELELRQLEDRMKKERGEALARQELEARRAEEKAEARDRLLALQDRRRAAALELRDARVSFDRSTPDLHVHEMAHLRRQSPSGGRLRSLLDVGAQEAKEEVSLETLGRTLELHSPEIKASHHPYSTDERTPQIRAQNHHSSERHGLRSALGRGASSLQSTMFRPTRTPSNMPPSTPHQSRGKFD